MIRWIMGRFGESYICWDAKSSVSEFGCRKVYSRFHLVHRKYLFTW